jgi:hypothetical protein
MTLKTNLIQNLLDPVLEVPPPQDIRVLETADDIQVLLIFK